MILIDTRSCSNSLEAKAFERKLIEDMNATLNRTIPNRTGREYYIDNKDVISEKRKEYRENNKDLIMQQKKDIQRGIP